MTTIQEWMKNESALSDCVYYSEELNLFIMTFERLDLVELEELSFIEIRNKEALDFEDIEREALEFFALEGGEYEDFTNYEILSYLEYNGQIRIHRTNNFTHLFHYVG